MRDKPSVFIWTEAFNCSEILPPFLDSFTTHHSFHLCVFTSKDEVGGIGNYPGVQASRLPDSFANKVLCSSHASVVKGYSKGHLGTARLWSNVLRTRTEDILIHVDADTVFLDDCITPLLDLLNSGYDAVGTRRPYLHRGYRKEGLDGRMLDRHPDALNTDLIAFKRKSIPARYSPFLTRRIRGKRPIRYPVVDFFDPIVFQLMSRGRSIQYCDSPDSGQRALQNLDSFFFNNRISFAAVGSGLNFYKNPTVKTSPGYRDYALSSFSLYAKYLLDFDTGLKPLNDPVLVDKLRRLDRKVWKLVD